jgi:hypothetical protein
LNTLKSLFRLLALLASLALGMAAAQAQSERVNIYYGKTRDMASAPLMEQTSDCYKINYGGEPLWFPKFAMAPRSEFPGSPPGLDYNARRNSPCGVTPPPIPPVAKATGPASECLPKGPKTALITYQGRGQPVTVPIFSISDKCIGVMYGGRPLWTTANVAGGVSCVGNAVQIDYNTASSTFNGIETSSPPPRCWK